jgi:hypothetical protein
METHNGRVVRASRSILGRGSSRSGRSQICDAGDSSHPVSSDAKAWSEATYRTKRTWTLSAGITAPSSFLNGPGTGRTWPTLSPAQASARTLTLSPLQAVSECSRAGAIAGTACLK